MKIGVLLSGCGVNDGAEIHESVISLLAIQEMGWDYQCISIDAPQHHVVNHLNGEVMQESRNMLIEAARIARGSILSINDVEPADLDALIIPGGFGSAKNFTKWAFHGPDCDIIPEVKLLLVNMVNVGKPIVALCISPVVLAKAFQGSGIHPTLSVGTSLEATPYDILEISEALESIGADVHQKSISEIQVDIKNRIICAPCYMMEATLPEIHANIKQALVALKDLF